MTPGQERTLDLLANRTQVTLERLLKAQRNTRRNIRERVAAGRPITKDEIEGVRRTLGILYSQVERFSAEEAAYRAKVGA